MAAILLSGWLSQPQQQRSQVLNGSSFQKQLAQSNAFAWSLATGFDSKFPTTKGAIAPSWAGRLFQGYADRLVALAQNNTPDRIQVAIMP